MRRMDKNYVAVIGASLLLSACGGGDSADTVNNATPPTPPIATTLVGASFFKTDPATPAYSPVGDFDIDSFALLNRQRRLLGMPEVVRNSVISSAAAAHSSYQVTNLAPGHYEDATKPGFTGVSPQDRVTAAQYKTNYVGEVLVYWTGDYRQTTAPAQLLFDAPFHRLGILTSGTNAGSGYASGTGKPAAHAWTWDIVDYKEALAARQALVYPYPTQTNAPYSWINNETPNPLASRPDLSGVTVGYPITMQIRSGDTLDVATFTITDSRGTNVACEKLDHNNSTETRANFTLCTPYASLKGNETYTVAVNGAINATSFSLGWQFSTTANQAAINSYDSRDTAYPPVVVPDPDGPYLKHLD